MTSRTTHTGGARRSRLAPALVASSLVVLAACGGGSDSDERRSEDTRPAEEPVSTPPPAVAEPVETPPEAPVETPAEPTTTVAPTTTQFVPAVEVPATGPLDLEQLEAAAYTVIQPTTDVMSSMSLLSVLPDGIPTPGDAKVTSFDVSTTDQADVPDSAQVRASFTFVTAGSEEDLLTYYPAVMAQNGYLQTGSDQQESNDTTVNTFLFDDPGSTYFAKSLQISIQESSTPGLRAVSINLVDQVEGMDVTRLSEWARLVPDLDGLTFFSGAMSLSAFGEPSITMFASAQVFDAKEVEASLVAALPANGYSLDPDDDPTDEYVNMERDGFKFVQMRSSDFDEGGPSDTVQFQLTFPIDISGIPDPTNAEVAVPDGATTTQTPIVDAPPLTMSPLIEEAITEAEFAEIVPNILGPTEDALGALAPLTVVIEGLPTPDGAAVTKFRIDVRPRSGDTGVLSNSFVTISAPGAFDDLVTFFDTSMASAGFTRTGGQVLEGSDGLPQETLKFDIPGSAYDNASLEITVADAGDVRIIEIASSDVVDGLTATHLGGWVKNIPGLDGIGPDSAAISYSDIAERTSLTAGGDQIDDGVALSDSILASLPANGYSLDGERELAPFESGGLPILFDGSWEGRVTLSGEDDRQFVNIYLDIEG